MATALVVALLACGLFWVTSIRSSPGKGTTLSLGSPAPSRTNTGPRPGREERAHRLLPVPVAPVVDPSSYRFLQHEDDGITPVRWSPCRPIHYVVRPDNAPPGGNELLTQALATVSAAAGLQFVNDGTTEEGPTEDRKPYQPKRYGERWAPVLITWATPQEVPDFGIDVVGEAGPTTVVPSTGRPAYVSGEVNLDAVQLPGLLSHGNARAVEAVMLHELGHLVGLAHSPDRSAIMWPSVRNGVDALQPVDLAGLAELGAGSCRPDV